MLRSGTFAFDPLRTWNGHSLARWDWRNKDHMLTDWELWACANHYVEKHGEDAPIVAAMRANELLAKGDHEGLKTYKTIIRRIEVLLALPDERQVH